MLQVHHSRYSSLNGTSIAAGALVCVIIFFAGRTLGDDGLGYTDTPRLPDSPWRVHDRQRPQPPMVTPGKEPGAPPADAVVLFDGKDLSQWEGGNAKGIEDGCINIIKTGQIQTKKQFGDCQLHVEWATPAVADGDALNWGNSGVFLLGKYELQIIESHDSKIYAAISAVCWATRLTMASPATILVFAAQALRGSGCHAKATDPTNRNHNTTLRKALP